MVDRAVTVARQRFGKSVLMQEMANRFPGQVVVVTPENLPKRRKQPMWGDVVIDECRLIPKDELVIIVGEKRVAALRLGGNAPR